VSFLLAQGHTDAADYPLCSLWTEATIAQQRVNAQMAADATLMHQVVMTVLGGKESFDALRNTLKGLSNGD
jgi:hypothetical protein